MGPRPRVHPRASDTSRRDLLAFAAIPGAFPTTLFDLALGRRPYQERTRLAATFAQGYLEPTGRRW